MKKNKLYFGEFKQYDKKFITSDNGIDIENVKDLAFAGETLYIAQGDCLIEYADGNMKKHAAKVSKLFSRKGKLYAAVGNALAEIKKGKIKKIAEFNSPVVDISVALDKSLWLITKEDLYLSENDEFV